METQAQIENFLCEPCISASRLLPCRHFHHESAVVLPTPELIFRRSPIEQNRPTSRAKIKRFLEPNIRFLLKQGLFQPNIYPTVSLPLSEPNRTDFQPIPVTLFVFTSDTYLRPTKPFGRHRNSHCIPQTRSAFNVKVRAALLTAGRNLRPVSHPGATGHCG